MTRHSATVDTVRAAIRRDGTEVAKSFAAGAAYMAAIAAVGGLATVCAANFVTSSVPQLIEHVSPSKFPRYAAHDLRRAERWSPDRWDTEISDEHGNENNAAKLASYVATAE